MRDLRAWKQAQPRSSNSLAGFVSILVLVLEFGEG